MVCTLFHCDIQSFSSLPSVIVGFDKSVPSDGFDFSVNRSVSLEAWGTVPVSLKSNSVTRLCLGVDCFG